MGSSDRQCGAEICLVLYLASVSARLGGGDDCPYIGNADGGYDERAMFCPSRRLIALHVEPEDCDGAIELRHPKSGARTQRRRQVLESRLDI